MPDVFASGRASSRDIIVRSGGKFPRASGLRTTPRGPLRVELHAAQGEPADSVETRVRRELDELEAIAETVEQAWPRCDGERPSEAHHWLAAGLDDDAVVAWLEVGVYAASAAAELRAVQLEPRDVAGEHADGVTIGLAFARRELTLAEVQRAALGEEVAC